VFGGAFARVPGQGGLVWMVLQYVLGLRRLGHQVVLIEPLAEADLRPAGSPLDVSDNAREFRRVVDAFGIEGSAALLLAGGERPVGLDRESLERAVADADLVIDVAGGLSALGGLIPLERVPVRVYLDVDPGFTQLWHAVEGIDMRFDGYTRFATVGLTFESGGHAVPACGIDWISTPQPVVLDHWPVAGRVERPALTTVANWRGYGSIACGGRSWSTARRCTRCAASSTCRGAPARRSSWRWRSTPASPATSRRWRRTAGGCAIRREVAATPQAYRRFVQGSRGELGVAKSGYVEGRCGWFSDRSVCYLASGRPVIAQETGFSEALPVGAGLFAFETAEDVETALEAAGPRRARATAAQRAPSPRSTSSRTACIGRLLSRVGVAA
jgi:hypothetical protein